jgi:poly(A) polymerase/tRNA nucleotidyltransferase (CCA-adding enzyme)
VAEDYLRVLRFFRFFARYATIAPDPATLSALRGGVPRLDSLSAERVWHELTLILLAPDPIGAVALMDRLGVLAAVVPEGTNVATLGQLIARGAPVDALLRLAALLTGDVASFAARLKLSAAQSDRLLALRTAPLATPDHDDAALRRKLADAPVDVLVDRTWLSGGDGPEWSLLRDRLQSMPVPVFPLEGRDILSLGISPGPRVGALLRSVRSWWLAGGCTADAEACRAELQRQISG